MPVAVAPPSLMPAGWALPGERDLLAEPDPEPEPPLLSIRLGLHVAVGGAAEEPDAAASVELGAVDLDHLRLAFVGHFHRDGAAGIVPGLEVGDADEHAPQRRRGADDEVSPRSAV